jgi:uncharacterized delta-60 repeat protein
MHGCRVRIGVAASVAALAVLAGNAFASAGDLDASFGINGKQTVNFGNDDTGTVDLALQPDGKIIMVGTTHDPAAGSFIVFCRLLPNGTLDTSFGNAGEKGFQSGANSTGTAVAIAPDGHILVGGFGGDGNNRAFVFSRRNADGNPDSTFGSSGVSLIQFSGGNSFLRDLALQSDGKVVGVGAYAPSDQGPEDFAVARLKQNGTFDDSFATNGRETIGFGGSDAAYSVLIQPDQKIVVSGGGTSVSDFVATRLTTTGTLDGSFGTGGYSDVDFGHYENAYASAIQPDGKVVLAGTTGTGSQSDMAIARLRTDGALDPTFSGDGKMTVDFGGTKDAANSVVIQADGKILLGGFGGPNNDLLLTRLNADGTLDTTFAPDGRVAIDFNGTETGGVIGLQPDGARVIGGTTSVNGDFAVARVAADATPGGTPAPPVDPTDPTAPGPAGSQCAGKAVTITGTEQRDKLKGTPGDDVISTLGGNDKVKGGAGDDVICSGDGNDKVFGGAGADRLLGGDGRDRLQGGGGPDTLKGGIGNDFLNGGGGENSLHGGPGHDQQKP